MREIIHIQTGQCLSDEKYLKKSYIRIIRPSNLNIKPHFFTIEHAVTKSEQPSGKLSQMNTVFKQTVSGNTIILKHKNDWTFISPKPVITLTFLDQSVLI